MTSETSTEEIVRALPPNQRCFIRNCGRATGRLFLRAARNRSSGDELVGMAICKSAGDLRQIPQRPKPQHAMSFNAGLKALLHPRTAVPVVPSARKFPVAP